MSNPIISETQTVEPIPSLPRRTVGTQALIWVAIILGLVAVALSAYNFYLFAENDRGIGVLSYAFILCFGVGAIAYIPLFVIAYLISKSQNAPSSSQGVYTLLFCLPWIPASVLMLLYPFPIQIIGAVALLAIIIFSIWAIWHLRQFRMMK